MYVQIDNSTGLEFCVDDFNIYKNNNNSASPSLHRRPLNVSCTSEWI